MIEPTLIIHTAQISKWRKLKELGFNYFDITVKSGLKPLAPDWDFLMEYKNSNKDKAAEDAYTQRYIAKLERLWETNPRYFDFLNEHSEVVFVCYCPAGKFCHRHILIDWYISKPKNRVVAKGNEIL